MLKMNCGYRRLCKVSPVGSLHGSKRSEELPTDESGFVGFASFNFAVFFDFLFASFR